MRLAFKALVAVACASLGLSLLAPAAAHASPEPLSTPRVAPIAITTSAPLFWPNIGKTTLEPGAEGAVNSPPLPITAKSAVVKLDLLGPDTWTAHFATTLPSLSKGKRLLRCAAIGLAALALAEDPDPNGALASVLFFALTQACFDAFAQISTPRMTRAEGCGPMANIQVPVSVSHTSAGYAVNLTGQVANAKPKFTARCRVDGKKVTLRLKAKKGKTLAKTIGPTINVGIVASPTNTGAAPINVTFAKTR